ncbi:dTDP-4-dehydrorhamnose 3,5-epimerase [Bacteroidota bacterium]
MRVIQTDFDGLVVLEPKVFEDQRGYFFESYNESVLKNAGIDYNFVQDNESKSSYGVIRGLHMQSAPYSQTKLIRVLEGTIFDVIADLRNGSPSYGKWFGIELSDQNKKQLLIPKGFCHGFSVLSETATVFYKCDEFYTPSSEVGIHHNDPDLNIDWKIMPEDRIISEKDSKLPFLKDFSA